MWGKEKVKVKQLLNRGMTDRVMHAQYLPQKFGLYVKNARIHCDIFLARLIHEVSEIQWDVVCLSETWATDGNYTLDGGHRLFCCRDEFRHSGVAILVNARWAPCIIDFCKVSDRVGYVDLVLNGTTFRIISVYVPHAGYDVNYYTVCFDHLAQAILAQVDQDPYSNKREIGLCPLCCS